ncbi:hypothetical protein FRC12_013805 [Ceratobasidium sp. 428]|nr:hypothetical protein FRC12_013805 [Ceratobasidium sp. 428]
MNMTQEDFFAFARANGWTLQPPPTQPTAAAQPTANVELTVSISKIRKFSRSTTSIFTATDAT